MAYIKVDHSKFTDAANAVDTYIRTMKSKMDSATSEVNTLQSNWQGSDYNQFKIQWTRVTNKDSTYSQMLKSLESYSNFLKFASNKYKDAQAKAVNRANNLPRW